MNAFLHAEAMLRHSGMKYALALLLALGLPLVDAPAASAQKAPTSGSSVRAHLVGSWRLVSRQSRRTDGKLEPDPGLSTVPLGILIYDESGHVAAQLSRRDRSVTMLGEECQAAATTK